MSGVGSATEHSDVHSWYHGTIGSPYPNWDGNVLITDDWYAGEYSRYENGFAFSRLNPNGPAKRAAFPGAISSSHGGTGSRFAPDQGGGAQWANIGNIQLPPYPQNRIPQGQSFNVTYQYQDRDSGMLIEWFADTDTDPLNGTGVALASQNLGSTGNSVVANGSVSIPTAGLNIGVQRQLLAKITSANNGAVRYEYGNSTFTVTWPEFVLNSITPSQVTAGAGVTSLTLQGGGFTITDKLIISSGGSPTTVTPTSITANQITANFDFGSTPKTWSLLVRQFVDNIPFRDSESLNVQVVSAPTPTGPTITSVSPSPLPPSFSTQLINIYGSNFKASADPNASTLIFRDPANNPYVRTPIFISSSQLQYNITVQSAVGTWSVTVTNAGQAASNLKTFLVETPTPNTGSITVNITPAGAISAGAQWRVDSGSYRNTGDTATGLTPGSHTVSFKAVSGYNTPASLTLNIVANQQATVNAIYSAIANCNYSLSSSGDTWAAAGGSDAFSVLTSAGCAWTATENLSWVSITSGSSGVGSHSVGYQVDYNPSTSPRSGVITAGGQYFNINQNGNQLACTFSLSSPGANFESGGGSGSFTLTTDGICDWEATTNANWISITSAKTGTGTSSIQYNVQANPGTASRSATINVAGKTFSIVQSGLQPPPGTLMTGLARPRGMCQDSDYIYVIETTSGVVSRVNKTTYAIQALSTLSGKNGLLSITADANSLYIATGNGEINALPKTGGSASPILTGDSPAKLFFYNGRIYFTRYAAGEVASISTSGGAVTLEASGTPNANGITVDSSGIYWCEFDGDSQVFRKTGGIQTPLINQNIGNAAANGLSLLVRGTTLYYTAKAGVYSVPISGGVNPVKLGTFNNSGTGLACDGTNIYTVQGSADGRLYQIALSDGATTILATNAVVGIETLEDGEKAYYLTTGIGTPQGKLQWVNKIPRILDTIAPQVVITNPPDAARFNDPALNVSGIASDDTGVATVEVRLNGGNWQPATGTTNWTRSVSLVVSNNTIEARSRDNAGNYSPLGAVTVTYIPPDAKLPQAITFGALSKQVFGDAPFALSATASSGLPVSFSVLSGPAVLSGNILTMTGAGLVVLRASQSGDATYNAAPNVDQVLLIVPGNNVITDAQRLANGMFTMRFYGDTGTNYVVKASTNLVNWLPLATNQISGLGYLEFTDISSTNFSRRFYWITPQ